MRERERKRERERERERERKRERERERERERSGERRHKAMRFKNEQDNVDKEDVKTSSDWAEERARFAGWVCRLN